MAQPVIHVLPELVASRIAAGEVVERPASVVKELIENALDAGATQIEIAVEESGIRAIRVADDGCGMGAEDARLAFERHATSKIESAEQLESLGTFGFRGEALPSIASVSDVTLLTSDGRGEGMEITLRGGNFESEGMRSRTRGTTIEVRNLFHNTPARRKFLKSEQAEERQIRRAVMAHAFAQVKVAFRYVKDGDELFRLPATDDLKARIAALYGHDFAATLVPVAGSEKGPVISGYVSNIDAHHGNRARQFFTVNARPVQQPLLAQAVTVAFRDVLPPKRFPALFLSVRIDPSYVDVNIHPTKREVRFSPERTVFSAVQSAVGRAIRSEGSVPSFWRETRPAGRHADRTSHLPTATGPALPLGGEGEGSAAWTYHPRTDADRRDGIRAQNVAAPGTAPGEGERWIDRLDLGNILQVGLTFLVAAGPRGIVVVDQHTAHERILFEEVRRAIAGSSGASQQLLLPETIETDPETITVVEEYAETIAAAGFALRPAGPRSVLLEAVPAGIRDAGPSVFLRDFLEGLREEGKGDRSKSRHVAATVACHGAVRAGDSLSPAERAGLFRRLARCEQPLRCPHGRPTFLNLTLGELARRFQRE